MHQVLKTLDTWGIKGKLLGHVSGNFWILKNMTVYAINRVLMGRNLSSPVPEDHWGNSYQEMKKHRGSPIRGQTTIDDS